LDIGFLDHFQLVITNNYITITDFHTLPITPAHAKSFQSAFTRRFLSMDFNTVTITNDTINKAMAKTLNLFLAQNTFNEDITKAPSIFS
jgi:hypothetical protein